MMTDEVQNILKQLDILQNVIVQLKTETGAGDIANNRIIKEAKEELKKL